MVPQFGVGRRGRNMKASNADEDCICLIQLRRFHKLAP